MGISWSSSVAVGVGDGVQQLQRRVVQGWSWSFVDGFGKKEFLLKNERGRGDLGLF
jgi:hypothetical protein